MAVLLQHFGCRPVVPLTTVSHPGGSSSARPAHAHSAAEPAARSPASDRTPDTAAPRAYTAGPDTSCSLPLQTSFLRACKIKPCPEVSGKAGEAHALSIHPRSQTDPVLTPAARLVSPEGQLTHRGLLDQIWRQISFGNAVKASSSARAALAHRCVTKPLNKHGRWKGCRCVWRPGQSPRQRRR